MLGIRTPKTFTSRLFSRQHPRPIGHTAKYNSSRVAIILEITFVPILYNFTRTFYRLRQLIQACRKFSVIWMNRTSASNKRWPLISSQVHYQLCQYHMKRATSWNNSLLLYKKCIASLSIWVSAIYWKFIVFLIVSSKTELSSKLHRTHPIVSTVPVRRPQWT